MASYLTHYLIAKKVYTLLGDEAPAPAPFFAGAAGGDAFFLYRPLRKKGYNLGRWLHRKNVYGFFSAAKEYAERNGDFSYLYGYITHYATDIVFHPFVYAAEYALLDKLPERRKKDKVHFLIESDIDKLLADRYANGETELYPPVLTEKESRAICALLAYAAKKAFSVDLSRAALKRCLLSFPRRQRFFSRPQSNRRKNIYALENAFGLPHILSYLCIRETPDAAFASLPDGKGGQKSVYELFDEAVNRSVFLIRAFSEGAPDQTLFSGDFNAGKRD